MEHTQDSNQPVVMGGSYNSKRSGGGPNSRLMLVVIVIVLIVLGVIGAIVMTLSGNKDSKDTAVAISENVASVTIDMTGFTPNTIKVKQGQQVTWTNQDPRPHRLTADQQVLPGFDSTEDLAQGDSYTYIFEAPGTYRYYDPADPKTYSGTVKVE
jgi:plastocyanin